MHSDNWRNRPRNGWVVAAWEERRRRLGLAPPERWGWRRPVAWYRAGWRERVVMAIEEVIGGLPAVEIGGKTLDEVSHAELLSAAGKLALWRLHEYFLLHSPRDLAVREATLVASTAHSVARLLAHVQLANLQLAQGDRRLAGLEKAAQKYKEDMDAVYGVVADEKRRVKREKARAGREARKAKALKSQ